METVAASPQQWQSAQTSQSMGSHQHSNSHHPVQASLEPQLQLNSGYHSRDASVNRGRLQPSQIRTAPPRSQSTTRSAFSPEPRLERKSSLSYGHHRQTSIVHGVQHSRNTSLASIESSPLSPEIIAAAGVGMMNGNDHPRSAGRENTPDVPFEKAPLILSGTVRGPPITSTLPEDSVVNTYEAGLVTQRKVERMHSVKSRSGLSHHSSVSKQRTELKTPSEYALHHLFTAFLTLVEPLINQCILLETFEDGCVERICGPGAEPKLDQLISALGHIFRDKPRPLIDTVMVWRKSKSEAANQAKTKLNQQTSAVPANGLLLRRNTEPMKVLTNNPNGLPVDPPGSSIANMRQEVKITDKRATVAVYIVCRVLIEVYKHSSLSAITPEMAEKLEDIVFGELRNVDPDKLEVSPLILANWTIYTELLGKMSELSLESVCKKFCTELDKYHQEYAVKNSLDPISEGKMELLIQGMQHLKLQMEPLAAWDRSCEYVYALGKYLSNAHGLRIKHAYCSILERLLLWVAASATPGRELTSSRWKIVLDTLKPKLVHLVQKPRHWPDAYPLSAIMLCISSRETFLNSWHQACLAQAGKLKGDRQTDRPNRVIALQAISRMVWTYANINTDKTEVSVRKLEDILKMVLPSGKKTWLSTEHGITEPIVQIIRIIGYKYQDFGFKNIIFPLINSELFSTGKELKVEQLEPEKVVISIRAFLAVMSDVESGNPPPYPQCFEPEIPTEPLISPIGIADRIRPSSTKPKAATVLREDRLSRPMNTSRFNETVKGYYTRFCEILGKVTILCDNTFGGQATLDEKFGSSITPKTPMSEKFSFRGDDHSAANEQKQGFYDLFHVAVQALPRCLSVHTPLNSLINLLCTGTAHVQNTIAISSAESLKSIARQFHAQPVTIGFARFIFNFDARYSTMSDEGLLGPGHIENTLKLYVELLQIWIDEIKQRTKEVSSESSGESSTASRGLQLDLSGIWAHVDEIESHGFFFLCSQSRRVRLYAITVLRLITEFDTALGKDNTRIIRILEGDPRQVMALDDEQLSVAERSRLQKGKHKNTSSSTLIELCTSDVSYDATLWYKLFPNVVKISFETCPFAITLSRDIITGRLMQMYKTITYHAEIPRGAYVTPDSGPYRTARSSNSPEVTVEQWKLYLVMACTTIVEAGGQSQSQLANSQHARKASKGSAQNLEKIGSARSLFAYVIPLLSASLESIREAIVVALGSVNVSLYRTLLESLQYAVTTCNEEAKVRIGVHRRTPSTPRRNPKTDRLRTEVTHVYKLTSRFLRDKVVYEDDWILNNLVNYTNDLRIFLSDADIQTDLEFQRLRRHYCGLVEELYEGICRAKEPLRWMPFESRKSAFALMEDWCGYSPNQGQVSQREHQMKQFALAQQQESGEKGNFTAAFEIEKKNLRNAALSAMAALCSGPITITTENKTVLQFDVSRMLSWIDTIFSKASDLLQTVGRRALKNLILHNKEYPFLLERSLEMCYITERASAFGSYFQVVSEVLAEEEDYPLPFWRALSAILFTLGSEKREVRMKSARLLRTLEERRQKSSKIQDFDISISDKTKVVYKLAQFETSKRLAQQHDDIAFFVVSESCMHFRKLQPDNQRNMIAAILPWVQSIELQLDPNGGPTARSYMILANFLEITVRSSGVLHNEVQGLWLALATGPYGGNVQLILDFVITLCLDRKEQNFVDYAKQIVVYLSSTPAGSKVIDFLLMQITPKNMVSGKDPSPPPQEDPSFPYHADLSAMLPIGNKQAGFSLGQVALILLVDLMVSPIELESEDVPKLLQVVLVLWDHYTPVVQEQAREMLVHLIHELVISKIDDETTSPNKKSIEDLVEAIRRDDSTVGWTYEDNNGKEGSDNDLIVPSAMEYLTEEVVNLFSIAYEGIRDEWARVTLTWATSCAVRHYACRSFQIFRCISNSLDSHMLADMLVRLSNTIAAEEADIQTFSMEILATLKTIIGALMPADLLCYPQLFWTTCACLSTIHEREFLESLSMLESLLAKLDFTEPAVLQKLQDNKPPKWEGCFDGIQPLLYKGLKSSTSFERTLVLLQKLVQLPDCDLIGDNNRILFTVLGNLPRFLYYFDDNRDDSIVKCAQVLRRIAEDQGNEMLVDSLDGFVEGHYRTSQDFLVDCLDSIRSSYFPAFDFKCLVFLMGLLTNSTNWYRIKTMDILGLLIPEVDMKRPEVASHGPDLISPLLRLLQTDLCPQALDVLDHIMVVSGNPMERHHLRMSMASSHSRALMKQYERTQSLYGIPNEFGWSIPMPAIQSQMTRNNVHAVFYQCTEGEGMEAQSATAPEINFHSDDYQEPYFVPTRTATMRSTETQGDGNISDLVQKLDSIDDFFDDDISPTNSQTNTSLHPNLRGRSHTSYSSVTDDACAHLYDQEAAPILSKSLARSASTSSFQNGFTEPRQPPREKAVMSPMAFSVTSPPTLRPPLHTRSVTSPSHNGVGTGSSELLAEYDPEELMSDDDGRSPPLKPSPQEGFFRRTGSRVRRLTSGNSKERDREKEKLLRTQQRSVVQTKNSPRVPKVPSEYLLSPDSPDSGI
ncbi:MAG: Cell morphogenesis protein PAG1 [Cirrosporium novae-zelandiae]|nr:MAG: Cell morphogenesis protein PAG1 [Cirrosporium novae-zelandiae]